jgi:hypothetical protein
MKIADTIQKETRSLKERGLHENSFFHVTFDDGSEVKEHDTNWRDFSELRRVKYQGGEKSVVVSKHKIKNIKIQHGQKNVSLDITDGSEVYQAIRSESLFVRSKSNQNRIVGRCVGTIRNGEVEQEIFINGLQDVVLGFKK